MQSLFQISEDSVGCLSGNGYVFLSCVHRIGRNFRLKKGVVCRFCADRQAFPSENYFPDVGFLNGKIAEWQEEGIVFSGMIHSHPNGVICLSREDILYAKEIIRKNPAFKKLIFAVAACRKGGFQLSFYDCMRNDERGEFYPMRVHKV